MRGILGVVGWWRVELAVCLFGGCEDVVNLALGGTGGISSIWRRRVGDLLHMIYRWALVCICMERERYPHTSI